MRPITESAESTVHVQLLGGFRLFRDGRAVPIEEWQSKKARDVLKVLLARKGRPAPRDLLMETLWPDEDPARCANRLSVALSTLRTVLDPLRERPQHHFVIADRRNIAITNISTDVDAFLLAAERAHAGHERGEADSVRALITAETLYSGDLLEDDTYEDWADALREEVRSVHLELVRTLLTAVADAGRPDRAVRYGLRLLEHDPYDEPTHLDLIRLLAGVGRHGEARRRHGVYARRMAEIGIPPEPFPTSARLGLAEVG